MTSHEKVCLTNTIHQHLISYQTLLELGAHEGITSARVGKNGEVDPEKRQVNDEGYQDQPDHTGHEMAPKEFLERDQIGDLHGESRWTDHGRVLPDVQKVPQVDEDSNADSEDGKYTVHLGAPGTGHEDTGSDEPAPPLRGECSRGRSAMAFQIWKKLWTYKYRSLRKRM